jgi:tRNA-specific 2-thiouridylase
MTSPSREKPSIVAALSGGVDSAVTAQLLLEAGYKVLGVHLRLWWDSQDTALCARVEKNEADARAVSQCIGIPFQVLDLRELFEERVVTPFVEAYRLGRTPNPCILCNPAIKLGALLDWALDAGYEGVATGHYARIVQNPRSGRWEIHRAVDAHKDQSYFLSRLNQHPLAHFRTPLADKHKSDVRELATRWGLPVMEKSESQEICFIADDDYRRFLAGRLPDGGEGPIVDQVGRVVGRHAGIHHYTVGQRRGLGISAPHPLYVLRLCPESHSVVIGPQESLLASSLETGSVVWGAHETLSEPCRGRIKIRYRTPAAVGTLFPVDEGRRVRVEFDQAVRAVAPGQTAVFYDETGDVVLGAGEILPVQV